MMLVLVASVVAAAAALYIYVARERLGPAGIGLAALRWFGLSLLVLLAVNPAWPGRPRAGAPTVLLDRSLSMAVEGGAWLRALDTARALAGRDGRILGFGRSAGAISDTVPEDGDTLLETALRAARGFDGEVYIVTDGEVRDAARLRPALLADARLVVLPRTEIPGAALSRVATPHTVASGDAIPVKVEIATWGGLDADSARVEVMTGDRRLAARSVRLPEGRGVAARELSVPSAALGSGEHVLTVRLQVEGDVEQRDNARVRIVSITVDPPAVLVADPATRDALALYETLGAVSGLPLRGVARIASDEWIDMATGRSVAEGELRRIVRGAALLMLSGAASGVGGTANGVPTWWWHGGPTSMTTGDWYVVSRLEPSPLAGRLARVEWDSVPPLRGIRVRVAVKEGDAVLTAQLGRRGAARPLVVIASDGTRRLETLGDGFARWVLRGGASAEAFRALVAVGTDWLLRSGHSDRRPPLTVTRAVQRGLPSTFRWTGGPAPDTVVVRLSSDRGDREVVLHLAADGSADTVLPTGVYAWSTGQFGVPGRFVVEEYSDEFVPSTVALPAPMGRGGRASRSASYLREHWWLFVLAIGSLALEWAWRQRGGLP